MPVDPRIAKPKPEVVVSAGERRGPFYADWEAPDKPPKQAALPAFAVVDAGDRKHYVHVGASAPWDPGSKVAEIDPARGVRMQPVAGDSYWIEHRGSAERRGSEGGAAKTPAAPGPEMSRVPKKNTTPSMSYYTRAQSLRNASAHGIGASPDPKASSAEKDAWKRFKLGEARGYAQKYIYKGVPDSDIDLAAETDFGDRREVRRWDDYEGTGYDVYEMEDDSGVLSYFLVDPETYHAINVTGMLDPAD